MERARPYLKGTAVMSAVVLVGAFVAYRAGAFQPFERTDAPPAPELTTSNESPQSLTVPPATQPTAEHKEPVFMPGSKSLNGLGVARHFGSQPVPASPAPGAAPPAPAVPKP